MTSPTVPEADLSRADRRALAVQKMAALPVASEGTPEGDAEVRAARLNQLEGPALTEAMQERREAMSPWRRARLAKEDALDAAAAAEGRAAELDLLVTEAAAPDDLDAAEADLDAMEDGTESEDDIESEDAPLTVFEKSDALVRDAEASPEGKDKYDADQRAALLDLYAGSVKLADYAGKSAANAEAVRENLPWFRKMAEYSVTRVGGGSNVTEQLLARGLEDMFSGTLSAWKAAAALPIPVPVPTVQHKQSGTLIGLEFEDFHIPGPSADLLEWQAKYDKEIKYSSGEPVEQGMVAHSIRALPSLALMGAGKAAAGTVTGFQSTASAYETLLNAKNPDGTPKWTKAESAAMAGLAGIAGAFIGVKMGSVLAAKVLPRSWAGALATEANLKAGVTDIVIAGLYKAPSLLANTLGVGLAAAKSWLHAYAFNLALVGSEKAIEELGNLGKYGRVDPSNLATAFGKAATSTNHLAALLTLPHLVPYGVSVGKSIESKIAASKLRAESLATAKAKGPAKVIEDLADIIARNDEAAAIVYVDPAAWSRVWEPIAAQMGTTPAKIARKMGKEIGDALAAGGALPIPRGKFLTMPNEARDPLIEHSHSTVDGWSPSVDAANAEVVKKASEAIKAAIDEATPKRDPTAPDWSAVSEGVANSPHPFDRTPEGELTAIRDYAKAAWEATKEDRARLRAAMTTAKRSELEIAKAEVDSVLQGLRTAAEAADAKSMPGRNAAYKAMAEEQLREREHVLLETDAKRFTADAAKARREADAAAAKAIGMGEDVAGEATVTIEGAIKGISSGLESAETTKGVRAWEAELAAAKKEEARLKTAEEEIVQKAADTETKLSEKLDAAREKSKEKRRALDEKIKKVLQAASVTEERLSTAVAAARAKMGLAVKAMTKIEAVIASLDVRLSRARSKLTKDLAGAERDAAEEKVAVILGKHAEAVARRDVLLEARNAAEKRVNEAVEKHSTKMAEVKAEKDAKVKELKGKQAELEAAFEKASESISAERAKAKAETDAHKEVLKGEKAKAREQLAKASSAEAKAKAELEDHVTRSKAAGAQAREALLARDKAHAADVKAEVARAQAEEAKGISERLGKLAEDAQRDKIEHSAPAPIANLYNALAEALGLRERNGTAPRPEDGLVLAEEILRIDPDLAKKIDFKALSDYMSNPVDASNLPVHELRNMKNVLEAARKVAAEKLAESEKAGKEGVLADVFQIKDELAKRPKQKFDTARGKGEGWIRKAWNSWEHMSTNFHALMAPLGKVGEKLREGFFTAHAVRSDLRRKYLSSPDGVLNGFLSIIQRELDTLPIEPVAVLTEGMTPGTLVQPRPKTVLEYLHEVVVLPPIKSDNSAMRGFYPNGVMTRGDMLRLRMMTGTQESFSKVAKALGVGEHTLENWFVSNIKMKSEMDAIQHVWKLDNELWNLSMGVEKALEGEAPVALTPRKFSTPWGEYEGGHTILQWRPDSRGESLRAQDGTISYGAKETMQKHLIEQTGYLGVPEMSFDKLMQHYQTQIQDIAFRGFAREYHKLISHEEFRQTMKETKELGPSYLENLDRSQEVVALGQMPAMKESWGIPYEVVRTVGALARAAAFNFNTRVILTQQFHTPATFADAGIPLRFLKDAALLGMNPETRAAAEAEAPYLRYYNDHTTEQIAELRTQLAGVDNKFLRLSYKLNAPSDVMYAAMTEHVSHTVYQGAKAHFLEQGLSEPEAIRKADRVAAASLPAHDPALLSAVARDRGLLAWTMIVRIFPNSIQNMERARMWRNRLEVDAGTKTWMAGKMDYLRNTAIVVPGMIALGHYAGLGHGASDEDAEDGLEGMARFGAKSWATAYLYTRPIMALGASLVQKAFGDKHAHSPMSFIPETQIDMALRDLDVVLSDKKTDDERMLAAIRGFGRTFGLLPPAFVRSAEGMYKQAMGEGKKSFSNPGLGLLDGFLNGDSPHRTQVYDADQIVHGDAQ